MNRRKASSAPNGSDDKPEIPTRYDVIFDRDYIEAILKQHEIISYLVLRPERLKYHPFLVTRNPAKPPGAIAKATLMAGTTRVNSEAAESTPSEVVETPNGEKGNEVEKVVAAGEDQATLALVAALSTSDSPKRNLRKRGSEEMSSEPVKRLRRGDTGTPNGNGNGMMMRRSLRNLVDEEEKTPVRETRSRMNGSSLGKNGNAEGYGIGNGMMLDEPSETEEEEEERIEERGEVVQEGYGNEDDALGEDEDDALGGDEEDAEGEDDEEYLA